MKKYLIIILVAFLSFFCIDKVYAFNYKVISPDSIKYCDLQGQNCTSTTTIATYGALDTTFKGSNFLPKSQLLFIYNNFPLDEGYYDLAFNMFSNQINATQTISHVSVAANDSACTAEVASFERYVYQAGSLDYSFYPIAKTSAFIQVTCNDVYIGGSDQYANVLRIKLNQLPADTVVSGEVGIRDTILYDYGIKNYYRTMAENGQNQTQALNEINETQQEIANAQNETNDLLSDDDTSESTDEAGDFFSGFTTNTHGLTGIITAPITLIGNITSSTCSPLSVPLPFVSKNLSLPCMSTIYQRYFGNFYNMYKIITFGIVAYWVCVRIFAMVKDFKNPEHDEIEVMEL